MKALILVGGYGTRLRPLTFTKPKPLVPFANIPMILHQIIALVDVGVDEIVLAIAYKPEIMKQEMEKALKEQNVSVKIQYSHEKVPLGTGGPLKLAEKYLTSDNNDLFFVLNADVICEYPFEALLKFHKAHKAEGTIMVTKVEEPSKYGVVVYDEKTGKIDQFVEKPKEFVGDRINAGLYLFSKDILNRIEERPTSIEREVFPAMAKDGQLYAMDLPGFWMDIGQPHDYLKGLCFYFDSKKDNSDRVLIHKTAKIGKNCKIGPNVVIGPNAVIGDGVRLQRCVIMEKAKVDNYANINSAIVGWESRIGSWVRLQNNTILGEDVVVKEGVFINGAKVCLHKSIKEDILTEGTIIL